MVKAPHPIDPHVGFSAFIRHLLAPEKRFFLAVASYAIVIGLITLAVPVAVQTLINTVANVAVPQSLFVLSTLVLILLVFSGIMQAMQTYTMELFERRFFARTSAEITDALMRKETNNADKIDRFFEIMHIQKSMPALFIGGITLVLQMTVGFITVSFYHPWFLLFNLVLIGGCMLFWRIWHRRAQAAALEVSSAKYGMATWLEQLSRTPPKRDDFQAVQTHIGYTDELNHLYLSRRQSFFKYSFRQVLGFLSLFAIGHVSLLTLGGGLVLKGQLTLGQLVAAELILAGIFYGISRIGYYLTLYYELCAAAVKLGELIELPDSDVRASVEGSTALSRLKLPKASRILIKLIFVSVVLFVTALIALPWVQTAAGTGSVVALDPEQQAQNISAPVSGRIAEWHVRDGSIVEKGQPIVEIADNDPSIIQRLETELSAAKAAYEASVAAAQTALLDVNRKQDLYSHGLASRREVEQAKIDHASWNAKAAEAQSNVASAETKLNRQRSQLVLAPVKGRILRTSAGNTATLVSAGTVLATFVPEDVKPAAKIYVRGLDAPLIHPGREVQLQFEGWPVIQASGWPAVSVGVFPGVVYSVDAAASPDGRYRVLVVPPHEGAWPDARFLRLGSRVNGWVRLNTVALGYEFWRQLNGFPPEPTAPATRSYSSNKTTQEKQ